MPTHDPNNPRDPNDPNEPDWADAGESSDFMTLHQHSDPESKSGWL